MSRSEALPARLAEGRGWLVRGVLLAILLSLFNAFADAFLTIAIAFAASRKMTTPDLRSIAIVGLTVCLMVAVNNMFGGMNSRYSAGKLMPVELLRFCKYRTHP